MGVKRLRGEAFEAPALNSITLSRKSVLDLQPLKSALTGNDLMIALLRSSAEAVGEAVRNGEVGVKVGSAKRAAGVVAPTRPAAARAIPDIMERRKGEKWKKKKKKGCESVQYGILSRESFCFVLSASSMFYRRDKCGRHVSNSVAKAEVEQLSSGGRTIFFQ